MRILLYGINYAPELTGVGKYTGEMGAWLAAQGHEVRVVTAPPYYPQWRVAAPYSARRYAVEVLEGVQVHRCPLWVPEQPGGLTRLLHLLSFAISSLPVLFAQRGFRPDVVITLEPTFFTAPAALVFARLTGAKAWLHIQDFELDAAFALGILRGPLQRLAARIESAIMRRFDTVSTISNAMLAHARRKGVAPERIMLFPNWVDTALLRPDASGAADFRRGVFGAAAGEKVVLYSGNLGEKQGLEIILEAARALPGVRFVICGDGAARPRLQAAAANLTNVVFLPLQPVEKLPAMLCAADVHLVIQKRGAADLVLPSKLTGILAVGGAAVVTADPGTELHTVVAGHGVGVVVPPEDAAALVAALADLSADAGRLQTIQSAARGYAEAWLNREAVLGAAWKRSDRI